MRKQVSETKERGNSFFRKRRFRKALEQYQEGVLLCNKLYRHIFWSNIAAVFLRMGDAKNALEYSWKIVKDKPSFEKGYVRLIRSLVLTGQPILAQDYLKNIKDEKMLSILTKLVKDQVGKVPSPSTCCVRSMKSYIIPPNEDDFGSSQLNLFCLEVLYLFFHNGKIHGFGGYLSDWHKLNDVFVFDDIQWKWKKLKTRGSEPPPMYLHRLVKVDSKLYVFGGRYDTTEGLSEISTGCSDVLYCLNLKTLTWTIVKPQNKGPSARVSFHFFHHEQKLYVLEGAVFVGRQTMDFPEFSRNSVYDIKTNTWKNDIFMDKVQKKEEEEERLSMPEMCGTNTTLIFDKTKMMNFSRSHFLGKNFVVNEYDLDNLCVLKKNVTTGSEYVPKMKPGGMMQLDNHSLIQRITRSQKFYHDGTVWVLMIGKFLLRFDLEERKWKKYEILGLGNVLEDLREQWIQTVIGKGRDVSYTLAGSGERMTMRQKGDEKMARIRMGGKSVVNGVMMNGLTGVLHVFCVSGHVVLVNLERNGVRKFKRKMSTRKFFVDVHIITIR